MSDKLYQRFINDFNQKIHGKTINEWSTTLADRNEKAFNVDHPGTLFKLYSLYAYLIFPYLPIISNLRRKNNGKMIYVDLFAGNGLNKIELGKSKYFVCGSPILALLATYILSQGKSESCFFDKMILVEKDRENVDLLKERLKLIIKDLGIKHSVNIGDNIQSDSKILVLKGNVKEANFINQLTNEIDRIWNNKLLQSMLFVDPGSPENLDMNMLKQLLGYPGDLLMLLHPGIFAEMINKKRYKITTLRSMLGLQTEDVQSIYTNTHTPSKLITAYVDRYKEAVKEIEMRRLTKGSRFREKITEVPIKTGEANYVLLYATRETGGRDYLTWQGVFHEFAKHISQLSDSGPLALEILTGNQQRLDGWV
ncbi:MAG: three-Cys-motif partner protein TcmP [Nitrososphaeraceae archaeon]